MTLHDTASRQVTQTQKTMGKDQPIRNVAEINVEVAETLERLSYDLVHEVQVVPALEDFSRQLTSLRLTMLLEDWRRVCRAVLESPAGKLLQTCPLTAQSVRRPRGYQGDAVLLDFIYGIGNETVLEELPSRSKTIYDFHTGCSAGKAVRDRRVYIAQLIDEICAARVLPRIISVAAGHLREASLSHALTERDDIELIALDSDPLSLETVDRLGNRNVTTHCASFIDLLRNPSAYGTFDLIYTAGLLDYLNQGLAQRLVSKLKAMLRPGGTLLYANYLHTTYDAAYLEAVQDWWLLYRSKEEIVDLALSSISHGVQLTYSENTLGNVGYVRLDLAS